MKENRSERKKQVIIGMACKCDDVSNVFGIKPILRHVRNVPADKNNTVIVCSLMGVGVYMPCTVCFFFFLVLGEFVLPYNYFRHVIVVELIVCLSEIIVKNQYNIRSIV